MGKYIDADRLCAEIEKIYKSEIWPWLSGVSPKSVIYEYVLPLIDSLQKEQPEESVPNDLEEAAGKSSTQYYQDAGYSPFPNVETAAHKSGFIAGAKWQAEHTPLPEDTVLFNKGVEEGKRLMMEEAVEGEVVKDINNKLAVTAKNVNLDKFKFGEKVRVIVLPKED